MFDVLDAALGDASEPAGGGSGSTGGELSLAEGKPYGYVIGEGVPMEGDAAGRKEFGGGRQFFEGLRRLASSERQPACQVMDLSQFDGIRMVGFAFAQSRQEAVRLPGAAEGLMRPEPPGTCLRAPATPQPPAAALRSLP